MYEQLKNDTFEFWTADLDSDQTEIKCICWFRESPAGFILSLKSNQLVFSVNGSLPSPVLRVDPLSQRVKEGDPLIFLCSTEGENAEKKFHFYKDGVEITSSYEALRKDSSDLSDPLQNGSLRIPHATFNHSGEFACSYEENINGRWILSPWSQEVNVTVLLWMNLGADGLRSPVLKVEPLSQRMKEGDPLLFLCSTEGDNAEKKFHFYKDGVEITSREEGLLDPSTEPTNPLQNASLRIPHASFNHNGEFACSYEEKRSNRWVKSSLSQAVNITVEPVLTQDSDPIWRYSWMAIPLIILIILLVPLAFYCWKKKSTSASQEPFQPMEKKEERNELAVMEPPAATAATSSPVKDSEVTYSCIQVSFSPSPPGPTRRNLLTQRGEEGILYSDIVFPPKRRNQNHP
ncbi:uncharacterized protein LOC116522045 [Thamnophis elegans]|uniref:uncharacterized protein LOC116522045 n=1 Tax=Thamnophis elegans TaxID=35005 RepID=UPI0013780DC6|nr:uncharacterized protein LOC116522045 [Thamnophis elegans]